MLQEVLPSTLSAITDPHPAQFVTLDTQAIAEVAQKISPQDIKNGQLPLSFEYLSLSNAINLTGVVNSINFSFWPNQGEKDWGGSAKLFRAFLWAFEHGHPVTDAHYLANLSKSRLQYILDGESEIPMLDERLLALQETGSVLLDEFGGNFIHLYEEASSRPQVAKNFVNLLTHFFPSFNDFSKLDGKEIHFHKRAQLYTKMVSDLLEKAGADPLPDINLLTIFADYRIPQLLRNIGILKYREDLARKVDNYEEIPPGSREEVEIRASSVWAAEILKYKVQDPGVTSADLDYFLWKESKNPIILNHQLVSFPHHRTRTIAY